MYTFKNIYFYYYLILMVSACSKGYSLSLEEALTSSLETNFEIKIEESNLAASEENVTQSISNYFPSITFQGSISENEVTGIKSQTGSASPGYDLEPSVASITITQNLFNGLANYHSLIKAKADEQSQKLLYENKKQEIILDALESYYNVLLAEKSFLSFKNNFKAIEKRYNSAQAEFDVGLLSKTDVALAKTRMSAAKILLINSDISLRQAKNLFMDITGKKAQNLEFESIKSSAIYNIDEFIENVMRGNFAIKIASQDVKAKNASVGIARSNLLPKISLNASRSEYYDYSTTVDQYDSETISANLTWQIFSSGKSLSKTRQAKKLKNSSYINQSLITRDTLNKARHTYSQYSISGETVESAMIALESAEFAYNGTVIEQEVGERTLLDVLDARQQLLNSEIDLFKEQRNEQIVEARLLYLMGELKLDKLFKN